jgi:putative lipoic acid-binding regulatory protein
MGSLVQFPCDYLFSVVGKVAGAGSSSSNGASSGSSSEDEMMQQPKSSSSSSSSQEADALYSHPFVQDVVACIGRCCQVEVPREAVTVTPRLKGKYLSVGVTVRVRAPEIVARTYEELGKDTRVTMKF